MYPADSNGNPGLYPTAESMGIQVVRSARRGCFADESNSKVVESVRRPIPFEKNVVYYSSL